jgi:hypothetical protein
VKTETQPYGVMAEFEGPKQLIHAAEELGRIGYRRVEAYAPYPIEGLPEALHFKPRGVAAIFLAAGVVSAAGGYFMQYYAAAIAYPLNVGGRPLQSWPSFIPITFEFSVLGGVLCGVLGMLLLNRLPRYSHPVSNVERFRAASSEAFFLCVEATDPRFEKEIVSGHLRRLGAKNVSEVPP